MEASIELKWLKPNRQFIKNQKDLELENEGMERVLHRKGDLLPCDAERCECPINGIVRDIEQIEKEWREIEKEMEEFLHAEESVEERERIMRRRKKIMRKRDNIMWEGVCKLVRENPPFDSNGERKCVFCPHPCHTKKDKSGNRRCEGSFCVLAFYEPYGSAAKIKFIPKKISNVCDNIGYPIPLMDAKRDVKQTEFWILLNLLIFYHEIGHYTVQSFIEIIDGEYSYQKKIEKITDSDEQKLCEYLAFKKMYKDMTISKKTTLPVVIDFQKNMPKKYVDETKDERKRWFEMGISKEWGWDIGKSGILTKYLVQNPKHGLLPYELKYSHRDAIDLLNCLAGALGRVPGSEYWPEITSNVENLIYTKGNKPVWEALVHANYNSGEENLYSVLVRWGYPKYMAKIVYWRMKKVGINNKRVFSTNKYP